METENQRLRRIAVEYSRRVGMWKIPTNEVEREFAAVRGKAIELYAIVEQAFANLFTNLMQVPPDYAGIVFFKMNNARGRIAVVERMLKKRHENNYNLYWNSLSGHIQWLDHQRNNVVHWGTVTNIFIDKNRQMGASEIILAPQNFHDWVMRYEAEKDSITLADLYEFMGRCDFTSRSLNMFVMVLAGQLKEDDPNPEIAKSAVAWRDICQRPIIYPPPESHPLYLKPATP